MTTGSRIRRIQEKLWRRRPGRTLVHYHEHESEEENRRSCPTCASMTAAEYQAFLGNTGAGEDHIVISYSSSPRPGDKA